MMIDNLGTKILLTGILILTCCAFWFIGKSLFGGAPSMICKDNKVYLKEMGYEIYRESPNTRPCFSPEELK